MIYAEVVTKPDETVMSWPLTRKGKPNRKATPSSLSMRMVGCRLADDLPALLAAKRDELGLDIYTDDDLIEVEHREFGHVKNPGDVRIQLMMGFDRPDKDQVERTRDRLHRLVEDWFWDNGYDIPDIIGFILIYGV